MALQLIKSSLIRSACPREVHGVLSRADAMSAVVRLPGRVRYLHPLAGQSLRPSGVIGLKAASSAVGSSRSMPQHPRIWKRCRSNDTGKVQTWSEYMGAKDDDGDSPWASLDAFADSIDAASEAKVDTRSAAPERPSEPVFDDEIGADAFEAAARLAAEGYASQQHIFQRPIPDEAPVLTHLDPLDNSRAAMVDVSHKSSTKRTATATCKVYIPARALVLLEGTTTGTSPIDAKTGTEVQPSGSLSSARRKGPVLHTAQLAGILAAKRTSELIPLCHGLNLSHVDVQLDLVHGDQRTAEASELVDYMHVSCTATTVSSTGVEMEALMGANVAALTLWDMLKSVAGREMRIEGVMVTRKTGGKSGDFNRLDA